MDINLKKFCDIDNEHLREPFSEGDHSYATNGHILIRVPRVEGFKEGRPGTIKLDEFIFEGGAGYDALPNYDPPKKEKCDTCKGHGKVSPCEECDGDGDVEWFSGFNWYSDGCKSCQGHGSVVGNDKVCPECEGEKTVYVDPWSFVDIGDDERALAVILLEKMKTLPGVELGGLIKEKGYVPFRFSGGDGVVMTMLK